MIPLFSQSTGRGSGRQKRLSSLGETEELPAAFPTVFQQGSLGLVDSAQLPQWEPSQERSGEGERQGREGLEKCLFFLLQLYL